MSTQETALVKAEPQAANLTRLAAFTPANLTEAIALAKMMSKSKMVPVNFQNKPEDILIAMQMGAEVGLAPMAAIQNVAVINGRPSLWGDAALGVVQVHPDYEWHKEGWEEQGDKRFAWFQIKRRGQEAHTTRFSVVDARKANLWGKAGPWQTYPDRMLQMRARGFGLRDKFADALRGLSIAEEAMDIVPDTSEAKRKREEGTLDVIGATVSDLAPSQEPNRGHGQEGMQRTPPAKQEDWICSECSGKNKHEANCSQLAKTEQDRKTSKPTTKGAFQILEVNKKTKRANGEPYLVLEVVDPENHQGKLYVWHQSLFEYLIPAVEKPILCEISEQKKGNLTYFQLEHLLEIAGVPFVDNKPAQQGTLPAQQVEEEF